MKEAKVTSANTIGGRRRLVLTVHIASIAGLLGADMALLALGAAGMHGAQPASVYPAAALIGGTLMRPLALLALASGLALSALGGWRIGRDWWVAVKLGVTALLTVAVFFVLVPALAAAAELAIEDALLQSQQMRLTLAPLVATLLLLLNVALGVYKPGGRGRSMA